MNKVIITTSNQDKFEIIKNILGNILKPEIQIESLKTYPEYVSSDEHGSISERAEEKVKNFVMWLQKSIENTLVIGVDDGFVMRDGKISPHSKEITQRILDGSFIEIDQEIVLARAYYFFYNGHYNSIITHIPFVFLGNSDNIKLAKEKYPLSHVLGYRGRTRTVAQEDPQFVLEQDLKYASELIHSSLTKIGLMSYMVE